MAHRSLKDNRQKNVFGIESPCIRNCCLDENDICVGCFRTYEEIIGWGSYNDAQKTEVIRVCAQRRSGKKSGRI